MTGDDLAAHLSRQFRFVGLCLMAVGFTGGAICASLLWWLS